MDYTVGWVNRQRIVFRRSIDDVRYLPAFRNVHTVVLRAYLLGWWHLCVTEAASSGACQPCAAGAYSSGSGDLGTKSQRSTMAA